MKVSIMPGLFNDFGPVMMKKFTNNVVDFGFFGLFPLVGTVAYALNYKEQEKLHHRF